MVPPHPNPLPQEFGFRQTWLERDLVRMLGGEGTGFVGHQGRFAGGSLLGASIAVSSFSRYAFLLR